MGLDHEEDESNAMFNYKSVLELDGDKELNAGQIERVGRELLDTGDYRLEETPQRNAWRPVFYMQASWLNRREIIDAIVISDPT